MMAEGVADAQLDLDRASAEMLQELAETKVELVREIKETIDADGKVSYESAPPQSVSLLELGMQPTFYRFSEATIEVSMDLEIMEDTTEKSETKGRKVLFANTHNVQAERKIGKEVKLASKLTATMVPVPSPLRIEPSRSTETE
ncbi:hypothetical protein EGM51_04470 [Verrucomicrobia bacterium S94]|nr:hypothetical protein EGM51_04470 [Verrucomicrobia bacterium S94]